MLATKETSNPAFLAFSGGNPPVTGGFPLFGNCLYDMTSSLVTENWDSQEMSKDESYADTKILTIRNAF